MEMADGTAGVDASAMIDAEVMPPARTDPSIPPHAAIASSSGRLKVRRLSTSEEMTGLAERWNQLAQDVPFRGWDWSATWWRHYQTPAMELCVLCVESDSGELIGLAPWFVEATAAQGRVIQFLGSGEVCSDYLTVLSLPGREQDVAAAVCEWLCGEGAEIWDLVELIGAEENDPTISALTKDLTTANYLIHERPGMNCWSVALPPSWDEFLATINTSRRAKIRQSLRKHFDNHEAVTRLLVDPAELDRRFDMLIDLHQRRHQGLGRPGCFASEQFTAFHREISRRFLARGKLRLVWTEMAGRPIAADYSFLGGRTVYYYQTGLEPDAIKVAPGWLGMIGSLKQAIEAGYRTFDFLRGDEAYKTSWGAQPRPTVETRIVARRASARLRHAVWLARIKLRRWVKQGFRLGRKIASETE
jgi:CelD/BcsL family acetyltransferase involved in cellulose biosynthesis